MKSAPIFLIVTFLGVFFAGCDTVMISQYRVVSVATDKGEKQKLLETLARVAVRVGLENRTQASRVRETLVYYAEPNVEHFRVDLGARVVGDSIIVDLTGGFGPKTRTFEKAQQVLREEMDRSFPGRYDVPVPSIPISSIKSLPNQAREAMATAGMSAAGQPPRQP
jgi:hypothetical protein